MDKIAVLIPCYNESRTIAKVVADWKRELPEAVIYVYDNNSTDHTDEIARQAGAVVRYEPCQGKGAVVRRMFREIDARCYIMVDGDDTYPAEAGREMADAFSYLFVKTFPVLSKGFEIETEMTIHAVDKNMCIRNVVVSYRDRPEGSESKLNTLPDGIRVLRTIFRLYKDYRPVRFFGTVAAVLFLLAVVFFIPVMAEYIRTGLVPNFPTLIVCGYCVIVAFLSWFAGLILQTLIQKDRQAFEFRMQICRDEYVRKMAEAPFE